jgi:hypothetical protein
MPPTRRHPHRLWTAESLPRRLDHEGENHERYIVDNTFFQRTFAPISWEPSDEGRYYGS